MLIPEYKLVIFDWDGTLMDSIGKIVSSMQAAAHVCQLDIPTVIQVKDIIGLSLPKALRILFPHCVEDEINAMLDQYKYQYIEGDNTPTPLFDNALELLKALKGDDRLLAVATGKGRQGLQRVFGATHTEHFFHASRCADETLSKPDPQMLLSLLAELNVRAEQAVMIGDSQHDLEMAQAAGVDSIGITLGVHDRAILNNYQPKAIVDSLSELQQLLLPV
ncbi:HAD-IA family hydrolase [Colwellia psychrerythraea]|uniref:HAD-superfamily hydrolase, subfamily IA, variant 1 n=1 Tax=Colwellia psychrerythraea TaxID=28229 RepID=A0A099KCG1_COLPS|nr:HAD-IA family hydrolase [Colwellia psychrerythraea]KGJ87707.1 HAD-superfamily hydrolase, subfamily IA, variant 1 [Colwellia psychrerythraea]